MPPLRRTAGIVAILVLVFPLIPASSTLAAPRPPGGAVRGDPRKDQAPPPKPTAPPCLLPQGEPLSAQKILQDLAAGRMVDLQGRIIDGSLEADAIAPASDERRTSLRILPGRLKLDACRVNGRIALPRAVLAQELSITCSEIVGDVDLSDSDVHGGLFLDRSKIVGDLRLSRATIDRDVSLKGATVEGSLEMSGGRAKSVLLGSAEIHRDVELSRSVVHGLDFVSVQVSGGVKLEDVLVVSSITAHAARFGRAVSLDGVRAGGLVDFGESQLTGGISISNLTVDQNLMLSLVGEVPITMQDVSVGASLVMVDGVFGDVNIQGLRVRTGSEMQGSRFARRLTVGDADFGAFSASETRFEGNTEFRKVRFVGEDPMSGALFASAPVLVDTVLPYPPTLMSDEGAAGDEEGDGGDEGDDDPEGGDTP